MSLPPCFFRNASKPFSSGYFSLPINTTETAVNQSITTTETAVNQSINTTETATQQSLNTTEIAVNQSINIRDSSQSINKHH